MLRYKWKLPLQLLLLVFALGAHARVVEDVRSRAPELVGFAGSQSNFTSLVSGLANVSRIELSTDLGNGYTQLVSFTPPGAPMSGREIVRALRAAQERLAEFGVKNPAAKDVAAALLGGVIERPTGMFRLRGTLPQSGQGFEQDYVVRKVYMGSPELARFAGSAANLTALMTGLTTGAPITLQGTSLTGLPETTTFTLPVAPTPHAKAVNLIELASATLQRYGIVSPSPLQIRAALLRAAAPTSAELPP